MFKERMLMDIRLMNVELQKQVIIDIRLLTNMKDRTTRLLDIGLQNLIIIEIELQKYIIGHQNIGDGSIGLHN